MTINSFEEVDQALLKLGRAESVRVKKEAVMNAVMQKIREKYETDTAEERKLIEELDEDIKLFILANKAEFEKDKRSIELVHGTLSIKTNPPKVLQLNKKFKVETTISFISKLLNPLKYLRTKTEINKENILADYLDAKKFNELSEEEKKEKLSDEALAAVGLRIDQDETVSYEIKWDQLSVKSA